MSRAIDKLAFDYGGGTITKPCKLIMAVDHVFHFFYYLHMQFNLSVLLIGFIQNALMVDLYVTSRKGKKLRN